MLLGGQLAASLAATRRKDCATGTGLHANAEAVSLGTTSVVWLISALGHFDLLQKIQVRFSSNNAGCGWRTLSRATY